MEWIELKSQEDINNLMNDFYSFHDSCIKESSYITGMSVDEKNNMGQDSANSKIKMIFQSQLCSPIEICFEEIQEANIYTYNTNEYFNDIYEATFFIEDGLIYWANINEWNKNNTEQEITYIVSKKVKYRKCD